MDCAIMAHGSPPRRAPARARLSAYLRAATRDAHEAAERDVDLLAACASPGALAATLLALGDGLRGVECALLPHLPGLGLPVALRAGWRRADAVRADALALGARVDGLAAAPAAGPALAGRDEAVGALYVLEGARLGGPVIARAAAAALPGLAGMLPSLAGPDGPAATAARWRAVARWLDDGAADAGLAVHGARSAFACVGAAVRSPAVAA
jgi:heme oxygenase (biliverdin-IX-beta and delta-forming)